MKSIIGLLCETPDGSGFGKIVAKNGQSAEVRLFRSISQQEIRGYRIADLKHARLFRQTRVYVGTGIERWQMGRVVDYDKLPDGSYEYEIRFPNDRIAMVLEREIEVRCLLPHPDPTVTLALGGMETQYWHDRRQRILETLIRMRGAVRGMNAILSSRIELVRHQVEVVRRVLEDPLQRYLLADEVGMGKTIEAGLIIRQILLSDPEGKILVLVPEHLVGQWRRELLLKFSVDEFPGRVKLVPYGTLGNLGNIDPKKPALLVIDEAHHLVGEKPDPALERLAADSQRLLLLSATPALGHEAKLLALLRLLDPETYHQDSSESFAAKVHSREEYGHFLRGLRADASAFLLRQRARRALELFPGDPAVPALAEALLQAVEAKDQSATATACNSLRTHVAETYRIHQRLIRTRRQDADIWVFRPRGPTPVENQPVPLGHVRIEVDEDARIAELADLLEQWRDASLLSLSANSLEEAQRAQRYRQLFEALGCGAEVFGEVLGQLPLLGFQGEGNLLEAFRTALDREAGELDRYEVAVASLERLRRVLGGQARQRQPKLVVFGSHSGDAARLRDRLQERFGQEAVMALLGGADNSEMSLAERFRADAVAWVLICDRGGEEGQNLHFADAVLHLDLPLSAARIEQRIGRLDRFGRIQDEVKQRALLPCDADFSPWLAWFHLLAQGFKVFNQAISDVQFLLEDLEQELVLALYRRGAQGLLDAVPDLIGRLNKERERLDNQYALDQVIQEEGTSGFFASLEAVEEDELAIAQAFDGWLLETLQFRRLPPVPPDRRYDPFQLKWDANRTLLPPLPWAERFRPDLTGHLTYRRSRALRQTGVQLVREGSPLVRALAEHLDWDDRGTAFATWRFVPNWQEGEWLGFRLCYVVEAGLPEELALDPVEAEGLRRRLEGYLPPWTIVLHLDAQMQTVDDPALLKILQQPYRQSPEEGGRDFNLGSRQEALYRVIDPITLAGLCQQVRKSSETWLRESTAFREMLVCARQRARQDVERRNGRLRRRLEAAAREGVRAETGLERELKLNEALLQQIEQPHIRLDAIGLFILSGHQPEEAAEA